MHILQNLIKLYQTSTVLGLRDTYIEKGNCNITIIVSARCHETVTRSLVFATIPFRK